jgi:hypothetical protein
VILRIEISVLPLPKSQLKNQAISNVESRINQKANEYANSFGKGKTEISIRKITSKNPDYSP